MLRLPFRVPPMRVVPVLCTGFLLVGLLLPASAGATQNEDLRPPRGIEIHFSDDYRRERLTWAFLSKFAKSDRIAWLTQTRIKPSEPIRDKLFEFVRRRHLAMTFAGETTPVPEPTTAVLMMLGLAGLGAIRRRDDGR